MARIKANGRQREHPIHAVARKALEDLHAGTNVPSIRRRNLA